MLIIQAIIVSIIGGIIFSIIGIIPGTDETATMAPITLILVLMGFEPVLFCMVIAILVAMQITHTIPTAMAALPGSTMAVPMVENSNIGKKTWYSAYFHAKNVRRIHDRIPDRFTDRYSVCTDSGTIKRYYHTVQRTDLYHCGMRHRIYVTGEDRSSGSTGSVCVPDSGIAENFHRSSR